MQSGSKLCAFFIVICLLLLGWDGAAASQAEDWMRIRRSNSCDEFIGFARRYPYSKLAGMLEKHTEKCSGLKPFFDRKPFEPIMIPMPAGRFQMGSPPDEVGRSEREPTARQVGVNRFSIAITEVTIKQFRAFVDETGYRTDAERGGGCYVFKDEWVQDANRFWSEPGFSQGDEHPVVCVSWNDARAYAEWLARATGRPYRLPTVIEWEYAARANTTTARFWGETSDEACIYANVHDESSELINRRDDLTVHNCKDGHPKTAPVGRFQPNRLHMHDVLGNVWEWTQDCFFTAKSGVNRAEQTILPCSKRVMRGGSFFSQPHEARSALEAGFSATGSSFDIGMRVALTR